VPAKAVAKRLRDELREHATDLGGVNAFAALDDILTKGNGGSRQLVVWEANHDLREVMREIVEKTAGS
jgi:carboxylate-amine ligase